MDENKKKREIKMIVTQNNFDKFCDEAKKSGYENSHSNFLRLMYIFGKLFVCRGKEINAGLIAERINGLSTYCNIFKNQVIENGELDFLLKQKVGKNDG